RSSANCLAATVALAPAAATGATLIVNTCADDGSAGSLRHQIGVANTTDLIDLSTAQLTCSTITLTLGDAVVPQDSLTLLGPSNRTVTITTSGVNRLLHHTGAGSLTLAHVTLSGGYYANNDIEGLGGCVMSSSSKALRLKYSTVTGCTA